ncbi:MAG: hypothetical protein L6Q99_00070 [Planctomycetes bacterium]|nr:hypothetical protein [Planctomycetota bacterium]
MRVPLLVALALSLAVGSTAVGVWFARGDETAPARTAGPERAAAPPPLETADAGARVALAAPAAQSAPAEPERKEGGEDLRTKGDDAAFARKYASAGVVELEAARDELGERWQEDRTRAFDASLQSGRFVKEVVAPAELDAALRRLAAEAGERGELFTSRTVPYGQGVMLEIQFVALTRAGHPELFALGDEVRWLENELDRVRRDDSDR